MILIFRLSILLFQKIKRSLRRADLFAFRKKINFKINFSYIRKSAVIGLLFFLILATSTLLGIGVGAYYYLAQGLPDPSPAAMASMPESTRIFDRNGEFLYEVHGNVKRRFVPLSEIPVYLQEATIAIEDKNFYSHPGFDVLAMARAFYINFKNKGVSQGASTITQQLARTLFLSQDRVYTRKFKELILAVRIEQRYSKDEILEMYLNNIPYGSVAYGVSAAAQIYLNKSVGEINFVEAAHLAALPKAPSDYSPFGSNKEALFQRAQLVIEAMHAAELISQSELEYARGQARPDFVSAPTVIRAPHFVFYVLDELKEEYGETKVREGGLDIYTSLDLDLQIEAERIVRTWGDINEKKFQAGNASLVAVDPHTGDILAMVGSRNYFDPTYGAFNAATSPRQPGSSFKPYVYAAALAKGLSPEAMIIDNQTDFAAANYGVSYVPRNYDGRFHGPVTVRKALAGSLNIPAVKLLVQTGIDRIIDLAERMGLSTLGERKRFGPALALGGGEVKLLEHTAAFGVFGNAGQKQPVVSILKISDQDKRVVFEKEAQVGEQVVDTETAYWINDILSDTQARQYVFGVKSKLEIPGQKVAAKTGTSQDFHDAWTIGYTPNLAVGVWSGNNDNQPMRAGANGYAVATPIWREFMLSALERVDKRAFASWEEASDAAHERAATVIGAEKKEPIAPVSRPAPPAAPELSADKSARSPILDLRGHEKITVLPTFLNENDYPVTWRSGEQDGVGIRIDTDDIIW